MTRANTIRVIPHPLGTRKPRFMWEHMANEAAWRKLGVGHHDAHDYRADKDHQWVTKTAHLNPSRTGGDARARYGDKLRPLHANQLYARRLRPSEMREESAIIAPDVYDEHTDVLKSATYEVLVTGKSVVSCKPGDYVVASAVIGESVGDWYDDEVFLLWADVPYVNDGDSDVERRSGGDIHGVWVDDETVVKP